MHYYRFEEGAQDAAAVGANAILDSVGGVHGTPTGGPIYRSDVPVPIIPQSGAANTRSLEFTGANLVAFQSSFIFHDIYGDATFEFWLNYEATGHRSLFWTQTRSCHSLIHH